MIELYYQKTDLRGVVCIHDSSCGPATGGTRLWQYKNDQEMHADVLSLARAMTKKCAIHGLSHGGGKAAFNRSPKDGMTEEELRWYANELENLGGRFCTGEDIGFTVDYVNYMSQFTNHVTGKSKELGGGGDPSLRTAHGLLLGMCACLVFHVPESTTTRLLGRYTYMIQGAGKVGLPVIKSLVQAGAKVFFCDTNETQAQRVQEMFGAAILVPTTEVFSHRIDFFVPCGKGGTVNKETIPKIAATGCTYIVPSANNVLRNPDADAKLLKKAGILFVPDYVVNGGGMINIASEMLPGGYSDLWAKQKTDNIFDLVLTIFNEAEQTGRTTVAVANAMARSYLAKKKRDRKKFFLGCA